MNDIEIVTTVEKRAPDILATLKERLLLPLPGRAAQFRMAHISRLTEIPMREDIRIAAVLILLFEVKEELHTVFIRRRSISGDVHGGQISFPGGRAHSGETLEEAAIRESHEEIGSPLEGIEIIGHLTDLHIPVSNHLVHPIIGYLDNPPTWIIQETEVEEILEAPLSIFLDPSTRVITSLKIQQGVVLPEVPTYLVSGHTIWGATAMILSELCDLLK